MSEKIKKSVQKYYGESLQKSSDLKTNACCLASRVPCHIQAIIKKIHPEVRERFYGCGLVIPELLEGASVLDLGSGSGRDCYILSRLVGEKGRVVGVDMTEQQLEVANKYRDYHREIFGFSSSNVSFIKGDLESLEQLDLKAGSFDVVVSNCVINLCADKRAVLRSVYNLLKEGGEMYFSDVYASCRIPDELRDDELLYGECLSGALSRDDFHALAKECGFIEPRLVDSSPVTIQNNELEKRVKGIEFFSETYRLFKTEGLVLESSRCDQTVTYRGGIKHCSESFTLDTENKMMIDQACSVSSNTFLTLKNSRFGSYFEFHNN